MSDLSYGPNTAEVNRAISLARVACGLAPVMWFFSQHYEADWLAAKPIWERARSTAEANGLGKVYQAAYDAGYQEAYNSTRCAWEDSTFVAGFTAQALVVRHLLDPTDFDRLYHLWGNVFGPPSEATIEAEPPAWPPAIAFEASCGHTCLHGAARPKVGVVTRLLGHTHVGTRLRK